MKILCIFLTFILTVSCGPAVLQRKTREKTKQIEERKRQCYLVRGACKTSCGQWEYKYTDCDLEPCCVAREYAPPVQPIAITKSYKTVTYTSTILCSSKEQQLLLTLDKVSPPDLERGVASLDRRP
ncbi:beta-defensin 113 [Bubalus kerabau]|uniref:beta-defensin 113 n=1 Tax=Bubalus bubalis TaxID=89462 RepID=UPI001D116EC4|nr:beta-defensin 113 [Bubalus bubalis]XP_055430378.1 beta-defensin 113 [Bubalus carabanensis]